jgi:hypothetical protein
MLTTSQQKVKQELEELKLKALIHPNGEYVLPPKKTSIKKQIFTITLVFVMIVAFSLLLKRYWI